ncbi:RNA-dependent RNA polymerase 2-like, partial [Trifolium medium]|nr:RNA-dependent RNA polymerase 2-like [Trifolium medium]
AIGRSTIFALEIFSEHHNWKSRGTGRVQFETFEAKSKALTLSNNEKLLFKSHFLRLSDTKDDIVARPYLARNRLNNCTLHAGF